MSYYNGRSPITGEFNPREQPRPISVTFGPEDVNPEDRQSTAPLYRIFDQCQTGSDFVPILKGALEELGIHPEGTVVDTNILIQDKTPIGEHQQSQILLKRFLYLTLLVPLFGRHSNDARTYGAILQSQAPLMMCQLRSTYGDTYETVARNIFTLCTSRSSPHRKVVESYLTQVNPKAKKRYNAQLAGVGAVFNAIITFAQDPDITKILSVSAETDRNQGYDLIIARRDPHGEEHFYPIQVKAGKRIRGYFSVPDWANMPHLEVVQNGRLKGMKVPELFFSSYIEK